MSPWHEVVLVVDHSVRTLCTKPYPRHPKGCPNYGTKASCPPTTPLIGDVLDLSKGAWVIWNVFDLGAHVERMHRRHPRWSKAQLFCCLYWQGGARKALRGNIEGFFLQDTRHRRFVHVLTCPEAQGVNVTETMRRIGIELEWPPRTTAYQVAVAGYPLKEEK